MEEREAARGDVQRRLAEERRVVLGAAKLLSVARGKDDDEMNKELKEVERWNDPAAKFLMKKRKTRSATGRPLYKGGFEPNRYGIMPGHRWDGVDRSNGFEKKWFAARSQRYNREQLEYAWEMDE
jgi:pre-mRNA-splicing factor CWC26